VVVAFGEFGARIARKAHHDTRQRHGYPSYSWS